MKNETEVVLRLSSNMISDNETNFPLKLLLTSRQVSNLRKAFANHLSTDIKACVCYFLSNFYLSPNDSPSKNMKNVFYFI